MRNVLVAFAGKNLSNIFVGIKEFAVESVVLMGGEEQAEKAEEVKEKLENFKTPVKIKHLEEQSWENLFKIVNQIKKDYGESLLIDVSTGNSTQTALMTSAAYVNGIMAYSVEDGKVVMLPVLKFSYYKMVPDKKMKILKLLYNKSHCCSSLEDLSKEMEMSLPLVSYHINGTRKNKGLKQLGLVETRETRSRIGIQLSLQGRLLVQGCL